MRAIIVLLSFFCFAASAQVKANLWYFGTNAGLDFSSGEPLPMLNGQLTTLEGCASMSDAAGNLLLYTNGETVWNKQHQVMPNGTGLLGDLSSSQAAVIVPKPGNDFEFFIFTTNPSSAGGLRYSEVSLNMNSGLGAITQKNTLLYGPTCEKIAVVKHANGTDFWVVSHTFGNNQFNSHLVTAAGVQPGVISTAGVWIEDQDVANAIGYMKISPDGTHLIACHTYLNKAELFDFDVSTGMVSGAQNISDSGMHVYGAEFSSDSRLLYISSVDEKTIWQYDLESADVAASEIAIATLDHHLGALQLAPNGKIYVAMAETDRLSVIARPDIRGIDCQLVEGETDLGGRQSMLGLPNFEASMFDNKITVQQNCSGAESSFSVTTGQQINNVTWDFGDGQSATGQSASHTYAMPGDYLVSATATNAQSTIIKFRSVTIFQTPVANSPGVVTVCTSPNELVALSQFDNQILGAQSADVTYFASLSDAQNDVNPISGITPTSVATTVFAVVAGEGSECRAIAEFAVIATPQPVAGLVSDYVICEPAPHDAVEFFDLSLKDAEILNGQDPLEYAVTYHLSSLDAELGNNAITSPFANTQPSQTIYARVANDNCYAVTWFTIKVLAQPHTVDIADLEVCDQGIWDGFSTFDLSQKKDEILSGLDPGQYAITFHKTFDDASSGTNAITENYSNITLSQTVFSRISHISQQCPEIGHFTLVVRDCHTGPEPPAYSFMKFFTPNGDGANDTWKVTARTNEQLLISIFDRNGKLLKMIAGDGSGWDGTLNGHPLPANDYWYYISGAQTVLSGHFSLMR